MNIRAKFRCAEVARIVGLDGEVSQERVTFYPVYSDNGENKTWSQATPSGKIEMTITNKAVFGRWVPEREYYVDFNEATKSAQ